MPHKLLSNRVAMEIQCSSIPMLRYLILVKSFGCASTTVDPQRFNLIAIPIGYEADRMQNTQVLHIFSDVSEKVYGTPEREPITGLAMSKSRVAPIKKLTLQHVELMGAAIAASMGSNFSSVTQNKPLQIEISAGKYMLENIGKLKLVLGVTAWVKRITHNARTREQRKAKLTTDELAKTEQYWVIWRHKDTVSRGRQLS